MPCTVKNPANIDLGALEPHIQGMYDFFDQKLGFKKPPTMVFDSDPSNQPNVLGKTAYYDPQSLEIHIYSDGRHPKDMLRSIAHELIHHKQNMDGRLNVGGYNGPGYYLENDKLRVIEQEAMLEGNKLMREYEDTLKRKENKEMSLNEWKNNELNKLLMKKFGIVKEEKKPDADGDGVPDWADKKEGDDNEKEELEEQSKSDLEDRGARRAAGGRRLDEEEQEEEESVIEEQEETLQESVNKVLRENKKLRIRFK